MRKRLVRGLVLTNWCCQALDNRVAGNSNLQVTSKGPMCINYLGSIEGPKEQIQLRNLKIQD
jgi:hypothetical protein